MNNILAKFALPILSFLVLVIGGSQTVFAHGFDWTTLVPYLILVAGAIGSFIAPLLPDAKWQGGFKVGIAILTTLLTAVIPFLLPGGFDPKNSWQVIVLGILNALATWLGQYIRTDSIKSELRAESSYALTKEGDHGQPTPLTPDELAAVMAAPRAKKSSM